MDVSITTLTRFLKMASYINRLWITNVASDHVFSAVPVTRPSMIMERITPKSLTRLAASMILGVRDSMTVLTIS